jgi:hypothetical protein
LSDTGRQATRSPGETAAHASGTYNGARTVQKLSPARHQNFVSVQGAGAVG